MPAQQLTSKEEEKERAWIKQFFAAADSLDIEKWASYWKEDGFLQFANIPRAESRAAIISTFGGVLAMLQSLDHNVNQFTFVPSESLVVLRGVVTFVIKGDPEQRKIVANACSILHKKFGEEEIEGAKVYLDASEVWGRAKELAEAAAAAQ